MERNTKIGLAVLAVLVLAIGMFLLLVYGKRVAMQDVFPSQPVFYARLDHVAQNITKVGGSSFWKNISAIDVPKVLVRNNVSQPRVKRVEESLNAIHAFIQNPWARIIFGKEIAFGFYEDGGPAAGGAGFLFALRLEPSVHAAEIVSRFWAQWGDEAATLRREYKGVAIITVNVKKKNVVFQYVRLGDVLVAASGDSSILEKVVDVYHKKAPGLGSDGNFAFVAGRAYPAGQGFFYVNARSLNGVLKQRAAAWEAQDLEEMSARTTGVGSYGFSFLPGEVNRWKLIVGVDPALMNPEARKALSCPPSEQPPVQFVPPGVIAYQWGACYDFKQAWERLREQAQALPPSVQEQARGFKRRLEKRWGVKIESDVLPLLGNEAGGYLTDVDTTGMFPYPRFLVFLKVKDRTKTEDLLARLTRNPLVPVLEEDHSQVKIRYAPVPLGPNMDPGYCFIGDYLVFSSTRQLLKKSIDTTADASRSLGADKTARAFGLSVSDKANAVAFVRLDVFAKRLRELLEWTDQYMSSQVTTASVFKQESETKKEAITRAIAAKTVELTLAEHKIEELEAKPAPPAAGPAADVSQEDPSVTPGAIENLRQSVQALRDDIKTGTAQRDELDVLAAQYQAQAQSAKLWMFNSRQVVVPALKGLEALRALGMKMVLTGRSFETEILLN
ncbi:MAG: DUF3352 domain-containing protein [Candidatus Omnitrophica bacterium]|nr:DUF3352 domain-containing protein [Candidatus Omnitrophota bacterium]